MSETAQIQQAKNGRVVLVDLKHGLALFCGTQQEMESRLNSITKSCKHYGCENDAIDNLVLLSTDKLDPVEFDYILSKKLVPRRVIMRLRNK